MSTRPPFTSEGGFAPPSAGHVTGACLRQLLADHAAERAARFAPEARCQHELQASSRRVFSNGAVHLVYQCLDCGVACEALPREKSEAIRAGRVPWPPDFNPALRDAWRASHQLDYRDIKERHDREFWCAYDGYLHSPDWQHRRQLVLARAEQRCEACGEERATQVHHLSYAHVGDEPLFELVAICTHCHTRLHVRPEAPL